MKASVIIPVWNGREYLPGCLDALLAQEYPDFEVIAVDNASVDGSAELIAGKYPQVRLIRNMQNLGFAGGCNAGLRMAEGEILVLLNQDTIVLPGWLQALVEALHRPEVGVVGCKILYPDGKTIQHAGGWIEWPLGLAHHYGQGEPDEGQWDEPRQVDYVTGAAMAFRRDVLEKVGLLDEEFRPAYFEDTDFCFRVCKAGYEVRYVPTATLIHAESVSLANSIEISHFYHRGRLRFVLKHLPPHRFLTEFVPAEGEYQSLIVLDSDRRGLRLAYMEAMLMAVPCFYNCWHADKGAQEIVVSALENLYQQIWRSDLGKKGVAITPSHSWSILSLREFTFRSTVPLLGPFIARLRDLWYNVAARWAVRDLIQQQEAINRQLAAYIQALEQRITALVEENALLARESARTMQRLYSCEVGDERGRYTGTGSR